MNIFIYCTYRICRRNRQSGLLGIGGAVVMIPALVFIAGL